MNTGQTLLVIGAFAILSLITVSANSTILTTTTTGLEMEANLSALSMAESMMDEILDKPFDQAVASGARIFSPSGMTSVGSLGPDAGETITTNGGIDTSSIDTFLSKTRFNDVDDYNHYHRQAWDPRLGWFDVVDTVTYVDEDNMTLIATQTFHKQITITVTNSSMSKDNNGNVVPLVMKDISVYRKYF